MGLGGGGNDSGVGPLSVFPGPPRFLPCTEIVGESWGGLLFPLLALFLLPVVD